MPAIVSIVIHCASSIEPSLALHLITALGKQKELSGDETYFIHVSTLLALYIPLSLLNARYDRPRH